MLRRAQILQVFTKVAVCSTHRYHYYIYAIELQSNIPGAMSIRWSVHRSAGLQAQLPAL